MSMALHLTKLIIHGLFNNPFGNLRNREAKNFIQGEGKLGLELFSGNHPADSRSLSLAEYLSTQPRLCVYYGTNGQDDSLLRGRLVALFARSCKVPRGYVTYTKKQTHRLLVVTESPGEVRGHHLGTHGGLSMPHELCPDGSLSWEGHSFQPQALLSMG